MAETLSLVEHIALSSLIFAVIAIISNAFWQDGARWEDKKEDALREGNDDDVEFARKSSRNAVLIFRAGMTLGATVFGSVIGRWLEVGALSQAVPTGLSELALFAVIGVLFLLCLYYALFLPLLVPLGFNRKTKR